MKEERSKYQREYEEQLSKIQSLENTLNETSVELRLKLQENEQFQREVPS